MSGDQAAGGAGRVRVAYVASLSHSGSTLLDQMIGAHSQAVSGGELKQLSRGWRERHGSPTELTCCSCGAQPAARCPFWTRVEGHLLAAGAPALGQIDVYADAPDVFERDNVELFRALRAASGTCLVVDSSKEASRLRRLLALPSLDVRPIHLTRSPFGVVYSEIRLGRPLALHARNWAYFEHNVSRLPAPRFPVRYERLVRNPRVSLGALMAWLGLELEESQLAWHLTDHHNLGGNPRRFERTGRLVLDDEWRRGLTRLQKARIVANLLRAGLRPRERLESLLAPRATNGPRGSG